MGHIKRTPCTCIYKRFVDEVKSVMVAPDAGLDYIDGEVIINEEGERNINEEENGMTLLKK